MPAASRRRRASASSAASGPAGSAVPWTSATPGATNAHTLSTWPSVSRSSTSPAASQTTRSTPSQSCSAASISSRDIDGFRLGCSRHCSVVTSVPAPSTVIAPPSSTSGAPSCPRPSRSASRDASASSASNGTYFWPQPLKRKSTARRVADVVGHDDRAGVAHPRVVDRLLDDVDAVDPVECPRRLVACAERSRRRSRVRSGRRLARPPTWAARAASSCASHNDRRAGHTTRVRSCGSHSAGIENPSAAGVDTDAAAASAGGDEGERRFDHGARPAQLDRLFGIAAERGAVRLEAAEVAEPALVRAEVVAAARRSRSPTTTRWSCVRGR